MNEPTNAPADESAQAKAHGCRYWYDIYQELLDIHVALINETGMLEAQLAEAQRERNLPVSVLRLMDENAKLRAALKAVEWVYHDAGYAECPFCQNTPEEKHKPDCARQLALSPRGEGGE